MNALRRVATLPLRLYQRWISRWTPPMCRFTPTCSQYAIEALETHGFVRGGWLATWRLLRCHPFARPGYDPVPRGPSSSHQHKHADCADGHPCERCER